MICRRFALLLAIVATTNGLAQQPAVWRVSAKPILQIGAVEGDPNYEFHKALSSVRLADGSIAVLNAGSYQIRLYDARGKLVLATGRRGAGPGEFLQPLRLYTSARDTLTVYDRANHRFSVHTRNGEFVRGQNVPERATSFMYDEWLYDRSWIDGPPMGRGRGLVRAAILKLPPPDPQLGYRFIRVSPLGHLWVRDSVSTNAPIPWRVYDVNGLLLARVTTPARFELHDIGKDYVLGVGRDALDVEYVQLYRLDGAAAAPTRNLAGQDTLAAPPARVVNPVTLREMQATLRQLSSAQEVYYSNPKHNYEYTKDLKLLDNWKTPDGLVLTMVHAGPTGWMAMVTDTKSAVSCVLYQGEPQHVFWTQGMVACG
jgi:hypothetical protein